MIYMYCATLPNHKKYVGITSDINHRFRNHKISDSVFGRALRKYKTWNVKIIGYFETYEEAFEAEKIAINKYGSSIKEFGYNVSEGGRGPTKCSAWNLGINWPEETKDKISKAFGRKPVKVFKNGELVGTWNNLNKCSEDLMIHRGNISHCLSGKLKSTGGYTFEVYGGQ